MSLFTPDLNKAVVPDDGLSAEPARLHGTHMAMRTWPDSEVSLRSRGGCPKAEALQTLPYEFTIGAHVLDPEVLISTPANSPLPATYEVRKDAELMCMLKLQIVHRYVDYYSICHFGLGLID